MLILSTSLNNKSLTKHARQSNFMSAITNTIVTYIGKLIHLVYALVRANLRCAFFFFIDSCIFIRLLVHSSTRPQLHKETHRVIKRSYWVTRMFRNNCKLWAETFSHSVERNKWLDKSVASMPTWNLGRWITVVLYFSSSTCYRWKNTFDVRVIGNH